MDRKSEEGFTLIETLIYIALYAIIMSGVVVSVYSIFESSAHNQIKAIVQEEGSFLVGKIDWALTGVSSITTPAAGFSGSSLSVSKFVPSDNPIVIAASDSDMTISKAGNAPQVLNNSNVRIANLTFTHTLPPGDGLNPESLKVSFTLSATTSTGFLFSQSFATAKYLRK